MKKQLIQLETAKLAKEKGFQELCFYSYNKNGTLEIPYGENGSTYSAPTQSLLQKWLRDVHNIDIAVGVGDSGALWGYTIFAVDEQKSSYRGYPFVNEIIYDTYEETLEAGLLEALKLIKNNK